MRSYLRPDGGPRLRRLACALCIVAWACNGSSESNGPIDDGVVDTTTDGGTASSGSASGAGSGSGGVTASSGLAATSGDGGASGGGTNSGSGTGSSGGVVIPSGSGPVTTSICPHVSAGDYELSSLPPTTGLPSGVLSLTDWAQHPAHGGWYAAQQMDACRYQADPAGFQTWHGKPSARLEVDPGDDPLNSGDNSERAECVAEQYSTGGQLTEGPNSGILYYATSYYFSTSWSATAYPNSVFEAGGTSWPGNVSSSCATAGNACNSWSDILQFDGPGDGAAWAVLAAGSTAPGQPQKMWLAGGGNTAQFSDGGEIVPGAWVDLVVEVSWGTGEISVWRRNQGQTAFKLVASLTLPEAVDGTYMRQGLYRGGQVNGRTDVLWVGPTARGSSFVSAEQAAFGTSVGMM